MKSGSSNMVLIHSIYKNGSVGENQECLKRTFEESQIKLVPSNMVLMCHVRACDISKSRKAGWHVYVYKTRNGRVGNQNSLHIRLHCTHYINMRHIAS